MKRKLIFTGLILTLALTVIAWRISKSWSFTLIGSLVNRVDTVQPLIALTFDDGPTPKHTERVLQILSEHNAKATFFVTGAELEENPEQGRKIVEAGHELGNHSYSHSRMVLKSPAFVRDEIARTDALIRRAGYQGDIHFRPPYAQKLLVLPYVLKEQGRLNIFMDLAPDSLATIQDDSRKMADYVVSNARPGSIVLMHVMYGSRHQTVAALPDMLGRLMEKGFRMVTVSELLTAGSPAQSDVHLAEEVP